MKLRVSLCALAWTLAGCAAQPPLPEPPAPPPVSAPLRPLPSRVRAAPVARVVTEFQQAVRKELVAVTRPHVTVEFVQRLHAADVEARHAMDALMKQGMRPSAGTFATAQAAVAKLGDVLAHTPEDGP